MRIRPTAVIFDYGNVLSSPQGSTEIEAMAAMFNVALNRFREAYWKSRLSYDEAALGPTTYWNSVAKDLSRTLSQPQIAALLEIDAQSWAHPSPVLVDWARDTHNAGLKTGLLSNMPTPVREYVERCDWLPPFDQRTFSCDVRIAKPAPEIFHHCLQGLGVDPSEILFLDDRPENARAAETLGMHAVVYTTARQAAAELSQRFDMPVPLVATLD